MWHSALQRKRDGAKMMLDAQQVIEEIEEEISLSVPKNTLDGLHTHFYNIGNISDSTTEAYITTISAARVRQHGMSESESNAGHIDTE